MVACKNLPRHRYFGKVPVVWWPCHTQLTKVAYQHFSTSGPPNHYPDVSDFVVISSMFPIFNQYCASII